MAEATWLLTKSLLIQEPPTGSGLRRQGVQELPGKCWPLALPHSPSSSGMPTSFPPPAAPEACHVPPRKSYKHVHTDRPAILPRAS